MSYGAMMNTNKELDLFHFDEGRPSFEDFSKKNGSLYWYASDFLSILGYSDYSPALKPIQKAMQVMISLDIDSSEHFKEQYRPIEGKNTKDLKLSRFACYLIAMNADIKKPQVAKAQAYFARLAEFFQEYIHDHGDIERVSLRDEVSDHEKSLSKTAKGAGVQQYAFFQNQGYRGLYNMSFNEVRRLKGVPEGRTPLDFMGAEELGANIFRITQTEAKIKREKVSGQKALENTAFEVGRKVRSTIESIGGTMPEDLAPAEDIKKIKSDLKKTNRGFLKSDRVENDED
jgi:DNA-damage-inducible protein D